MSDIMRPIPFPKLMQWIKEEYTKEDAVFGIRSNKFYRNQSGEMVDWFGEPLGSVIGPAAGPHSQLAQNIIAAYLAGSRFIELKTVQIMDGEELRACVAKPCINAEDECYNVEWSTELTVQEAYEEYIKAWLALHVLSQEFQLSDSRDFAFNMSVGYDLEGIKSPKIDKYLNQMKDASDSPIWKDSMEWLEKNCDMFEVFTKEDLPKISPAVSPSITVSTLHGCPPDEIERIVNYLLDEKKLVTFVKCNPTLLGYESARKALDDLGYGYVSFDDHHFKADLQYGDAIAMFRRLMAKAEKQGLGFGVKLTNTFPVEIKRGELPGEEMYMSGRALYPLSMLVARRLTEEFDGMLPVSYSGGADYNNITEIFNCNIYPVTMATTLLKPGGYERMKQLADSLEPMMTAADRRLKTDQIGRLQQSISKNSQFAKGARIYGSRKTASQLGLYDCFKAPCKDGGCPIEQQIPEYLKLAAAEKYDEAFRVIAIDNAMPAVTSVICDHKCQSKCTRMDYETSLQIRSMKNLIVSNAQDAYIEALKPVPLRSGKKAVVIGAGPAGIAAGLFLRRNGIKTVVLEQKDRPMGIVQYVIPEFRIENEMIQRDFAMAERAGVEFRFGVKAAYNISQLKQEYDYVILATGAWQEGWSPVKEGQEYITDALAFLQQAKSGQAEIGKRVAIIGGGDVAMDCARVAARNKETEEAVIVYRRTEAFMPAEREEIRLAKEDGVTFMELLGPVSYDGRELVCQVMELGDYDESGRRSVKATEAVKTLTFDMVIAAVGARVDTSEMKRNEMTFDAKGFPVCSAANESSVPDVYIAGDCRKGPATIVKAVADAKMIAKDILKKEGLEHDFSRAAYPQDENALYHKKGIAYPELPGQEPEEGQRCLGCEQLCEICNDVCPNRANIHVVTGTELFAQPHQIIHLDGMCNECGNCTVFCPHQGRPYKDKVTVFWTEEDFEDSTNAGFLYQGGKRYLVRTEAGETLTYEEGEDIISPQLQELIKAMKHDERLSNCQRSR